MLVPKISIVTPSFNQDSFIEETLRSVKSQAYPNLEHIVVDGGSKDTTVEILKRYSSLPEWQHLRWISEKDGGQSDALNKGFRMATGDLIGWLNSDDRYEPNCFKEVSSAFTRNELADFVYGDYLIIDEDGKTLLHKKEIPFDWDIMLCGLNYIAQPNVFFRRRIFDQLGYLNEDLHYVMDYEFWLRAASRGCRFHQVAKPLAACRWQRDAKTVSQSPRIQEELQQVRKSYWNKIKFRNAMLQATYEKLWNIRARGVRQWRKLQRRRALDLIPTSWFMTAWKMRSTTSSRGMTPLRTSAGGIGPLEGE